MFLLIFFRVKGRSSWVVLGTAVERENQRKTKDHRFTPSVGNLKKWNLKNLNSLLELLFLSEQLFSSKILVLFSRTSRLSNFFNLAKFLLNVCSRRGKVRQSFL